MVQKTHYSKPNPRPSSIIVLEEVEMIYSAHKHHSHKMKEDSLGLIIWYKKKQDT